MVILKSMLEELINNSHLHFYWKDLDGNYQGCNKARANALGLNSTNEIIGKHDNDFFPKDMATQIAENDLLFLKTSAPPLSEEKFITLNNELRVHLVFRYPYTSKNEIIGLYCLAFDITERELSKQNEKETIESTLDSILTHLPGHVYWKDLNSCFLGCNNMQAQSAGFSHRNDIIGKSDYDMPWKSDADLLRKSDLDVIRNKKILSFEETSQTANSDTVSVFLSKKAPLYDKLGNIIGILGISFDITDRKKIEEDLKTARVNAEAANEAKTEFLANMRHDIRTPLSGIIGFSEILKSESNEQTTQEYADNLIASSHALLDLMDEVLEAVRVSSGEIPKLKRKFNLITMLNKVIDLHRAKACEKKLRLNAIFDKTLPHFVIGDKIRLHRIVLELVGNALNFTNNGHVTLTADLAKNENKQLIVRIKVSDSGIGIAKDKQQEIYLQFKRLVPSYTGLYKGAGLGLYVVKQFVDELGGEIYVNSVMGEGTSFTCLIPLQEPLLNDDSGINEDEELSLENETYLQPYSHKSTVLPKENKINKVLVVEDNITAQKVVQTILTAMKCDVHLASSGQEALNQINSNHYDLIFMDIGLGEGADGYEVTEQIRKKEKPSDHVPIVALTAHAADESKQRCIEAGMDAVLAKPITQAHASNIINAFLRPKENPELEKAKKAQSDLPDKEEDLFELSQFPLLETEETLKNLGDANILSELLQNMIEKDLPDDFNNMKQAFSDQNYEQVEKLAHKIKGGALYVGTIRMRYACQYLERYQKTGKTHLVEKLFHQAVSTIEETINYIKLWLLANK